MRGKNAALHSRHLFSGFMRCGVCGGSVAVVAVGWGSPLYGCVRRSKNGKTVCSNRYTIRARVADEALPAGLQAKAEFQRLGIRFTITPTPHADGRRMFLRAEGSGNFEHLAFDHYASLSTVDALSRQSIGSRTFVVDLPANHRTCEHRTG